MLHKNMLRRLAVGAFLVSVLLLGACSDDDSAPTSSNTGTGQAPNTVDISNFAFTSQSITIAVGTEITWTNKDAVAHTVTSDDGKFVSSGNLGQGETYKVTFPTAGTYPYHCSIHPAMTGTVIVNP